MSLRFHIDQAGQAPALAQALLEGQRRTLARYGLEHLVPAQVPELHDEVHLVALVNGEGQPCAGLRLHPRTPATPLPLESAVPLQVATHQHLEQATKGGLVELGGLWVGKELHPRSVALPLIQTALWACRAMGLGEVVVLTGHHALPLALAAGFRVDAVEPPFTFPDARYQSYLCWYSVPARGSGPDAQAKGPQQEVAP